MGRSSKPHRESIFNDLITALGQSLAHVKGELTLRTTVLPAPPPNAAPKRVVSLRKRLRMSQGVFAAYLNVSPKTVQSWEQGSRSPKAGELRLLQIVEEAPDKFQEIVRARVSTSGTQRTRSPKIA